MKRHKELASYNVRIYPRTALILHRLLLEEGRTFAGMIHVTTTTYERIVDGKRPR